MSQEIRTEMNSIVGLTYLIEESNIKCKGNLNYSNQVFKACNRLIRLFEDFFDTEIPKKIHSNHKLQSCNLKKATEFIFSDLREYLEQDFKSSILLISDNDYLDDPEILLDNTRISRILHYLFQNAATSDKIRYIKAGSKYSDGKVIFYVLDPQQDFNLCREYFSSEDIYSSNLLYYNPHTSMNFMLAKKNVMLLGGKIWIEPYETTGTGFFFSFPVQKTVKKSDHNKKFDIIKSETPTY